MNLFFSISLRLQQTNGRLLQNIFMKRNYFFFAFLVAISATTFSCSKPVDEVPQVNQSQDFVENRNDPIVFTQVVQLEGSQEVPAVNTQTKGIAILRVSESKKLYSKVIIQKLAEGDALRFAHIHEGAAGINGPVRLNIAPTPADFGTNNVFQLTDAQFTLITTGVCYVNAHSNFFPAGIVRGQIR